VKDLLQLPADNYDRPLPDKLIRRLAEVRPRTSLRTALATMQQRGSHIALVQGKDGKPAGIIMLEDVLEELVGPIRDETRK
jgi:CBS domain containing-hemolysin-like protein